MIVVAAQGVGCFLRRENASISQLIISSLSNVKIEGANPNLSWAGTQQVQLHLKGEEYNEELKTGGNGQG